MNEKPLGVQPFPVENVPTFCANIILPNDIDRNLFVKNCYNTHTVSVINSGNQIFHNVMCDEDVLKNIKIPKIPNVTGNIVLCVWDVFQGVVRVVASFKDSKSIHEIIEENQHRIFKTNGEDFIDFDMKGNKGVINMVAKSSLPNAKSTLYILNKNKQAILDAVVQGSAQLSVDNKLLFNIQKSFTIQLQDLSSKQSKLTKIKYDVGEGFELSDEFGNVIITTKSGISLKNKNGEIFKVTEKGFVIKNSSKDLKKIINDMSNAMINSKIPTPTGGVGTFDPSTISSLQLLQSDLNNLFE